MDSKQITPLDAEIEDILSGEFNLDIVNFSKHNPGSTKQFIRLENDWFTDPKFHSVPESAQLLYIKLCCLRSASGERLVGVTTTWIQRRVGVQSSSCKRGLVTLCKKGLIFTEKNREEEIREEEQAEKKGVKNPEENSVKISVKNQPLPTKNNLDRTLIFKQVGWHAT